MFPNRSLLPFYRHTVTAQCLLTVAFLLLTRSTSAQVTPNYGGNAHQPYLDLLHRTQTENAAPARLGYAWALLASSYQRSGEIEAALRAYGQALPLLAKSVDSRVNYATALDNLGEVYIETGDLKDAERVRQKAFAIRSEIGNPVDLARSHEHLAEILLAEHRYKAAQEDAEAAKVILTSSREPAYSGELQVSQKPGNTLVAAYITLTFAQCKQSAFAACMRSAEMADQLVTRDFAPESLERAHADVALGFATWKNGDTEAADRKFQTGLDRMKTALGETHPVVITSMTLYRDFLKETHQGARADLMSRSIESARAFRMKENCARCILTIAALP
ncbi:tetratricopeptide repeat protein [Terriglobus roseus]|uniref:Tetratricopeptide repeat-containing protein n=1 Tax=Terriglobus roseus TaxID=392734 RepID=A0A1H4NBD4_9BACT|nr:tetratricopeptide repeat protein [Terriglobus roseus]SEB92680.1 Tetratricopeptide repeat-containing protein [Terriglobus roseus]